uniref:General transcription factor IIH subunit 4 n=2 Tax=Parascaris univalens TaxID=6257 RepID=A0A915BEV8_PARUN
NLNNRPLLDYLVKRNREQLDTLYESPGAVFAIFRALPDVSQQCVLKVLWLREGVQSSIWQYWVKHEHSSLVENHFDLLRRLGIIEGKEQITLNPIFRKSYIRAVQMGLYRASQMKAMTDLDEKSRKSASKDLGKKATERWECILHYLALPSQKSEQGVSGATKQLFRAAGLTSGGEGEGDMEITSAGFQFLLLNQTEQIWIYILHYLRLEESMGKNVMAELDFLLKLTLCVDHTHTNGRLRVVDGDREKKATWRAFFIDESWSETITNFLMHLRELGLVFIRKRKDGYFFITPLFAHLTVSSSSETAIAEKRTHSGYIIVETNYRVYAYTDSSLQLAILSTFTEMLYRFNDMSVGMLTRDSVRRALQVGITASQIISFLRANAHPETVVAANASPGVIHCVPVTVADQIRLWEDERHRLVFFDSALYSTFESEREYIGVKEYTRSQDILLWFDDVQRLVVVTEEGHDMVKAWWKANKANV